MTLRTLSEVGSEIVSSSPQRSTLLSPYFANSLSTPGVLKHLASDGRSCMENRAEVSST